MESEVMGGILDFIIFMMRELRDEDCKVRCLAEECYCQKFDLIIDDIEELKELIKDE